METTVLFVCSGLNVCSRKKVKRDFQPREGKNVISEDRFLINFWKIKTDE